ncbi:MAG: hypothetical protein KatS3mg090_0650 [Patescibacteria group bacterium]|nr:MAG: hypothetical protein KatS3mg090_0650 [Patescibacteria group bacterium]
MRIKNNKKIISVLTIAVVIFFNTLSTISAQSIEILAYPARQEITANPGETKTIPVVFLNKTLSPIQGKLGTRDFIVRGKDNVPEFIDFPTETEIRYSAKNWIELPFENATIPAADKVIVYAQLKVPADAVPGGHYASIYFETEPPSPDQNTSGSIAAASQQINALLYIKVAGEAKESASITKFSIPNFLEYGPIKIETEITNNGDIHIRPLGSINIYDTFGNLIESQKLEEKNIFPGAISVYTNNLGQKWMLGKYKVELKAIYGEKQKELTAVKELYIFPYKEATVILLLLAIVIFLIRKFYISTIANQRSLEQKLEQETELIKELKQKLEKRDE